MKQSIVLLVAFGIWLGPGALASGDALPEDDPSRRTPLATADIVEQALEGSVSIRILKRNGDESRGSGFLVSPSGLIATNHHVVDGATRIEVKLANGDEYEAIDLFAMDPRKDIAVIRIPGFDLPTLELGNSSSLRPGEDLLVIGDPNGLERTVSKGILSAVREHEGFSVLQMDAFASPGSSGGPIVNTAGQVVGLTSFGHTVEELNFGIPVNYLRGLLEVDQGLSLAALVEERQSLSLFRNREGNKPRRGVIVTGYGGSKSFAKAHLTVLNLLAEHGIAVANVPSTWRPLQSDSIALPFILERIRESGTNELLYLTSESSYGFWAGGKARIEIQCYGPDGGLQWKEEVKRAGSAWTSAAREKVLQRLERALTDRLGDACLSEKATVGDEADADG